MAKNDDEDALTAAQKRAMRTGRSFFPAANTYRGINLNARPSANAITDTGQGQVIQDSGSGGGGFSAYATGGLGGFRALPPDQNPAYRAALSRPRMNRSDMTWIKTPSGGYINAPTASVDRVSAALTGANAQLTPPAPPPINYGSQVGFSMLSNVPSAPSVPPVAARPYEAPPSPLTTPERIGRTAFNFLNYAPTKIAQAGSAAASLGRGIYGLGRDIYGGFTGNRTPQPQPSEMGAGSTPVMNPMVQNPWGNTQIWNRGLGRYFD